MKKIGIVTLTGYSNYGNKLQNYAVQEILKGKGLKVESIKNYPNNFGKKNLIHNIKRIVFPTYSKYKYGLPLERMINFKKFNKNIKESSFIVTPYDLKINKLKKYDGFVIGSDQVWNPNFQNNFYMQFLTDIKVPKTSISASFGISHIPEKFISFYKSGLNSIDNISVREFEGKEIVENLTNKKAKVLIDPTMMISKDEWVKISKPYKAKPKRKYILTYSIGGLSNKANALINEVNKDNEYDIVNLGEKSKQKYYSAGPREFLDFIHDAEVIITDSFHGIVFSTIFNRPFIIFEREDSTGSKSMYSRIDTFFKHFDIEDRNIDSLTNETIFNMNFKEINRKLVLKQNEFNEFIDDFLNIIE